MKRTSFILFVLLILFVAAGCSSAVESIEVSNQGAAGENQAGSTTLPPPTIVPTASLAPTLTPTLPPTPSPTPLPVNFTADNFLQWVQVESYSRQFEDALGLDPFEIRMNKYAFSPDGRYLAIGGCTSNHSGSCISSVIASESFLFIQDAYTGEIISELPETHATISSLAFTSDGTKLFYAIRPQAVKIWDIASGELEQVLWTGEDAGDYPYIAISPDDSMIAVVFGSQLQVLDADSGDRLAELPAFRWASSFPQFSTDGSRLAVFSADNGTEITIYDTLTWMKISSIQPPGDYTDVAVFSPDGKTLLTVDNSYENPEVLLWDVDTGVQIGAVQDIFSYINLLTFSPDGELLLVAGLTPDNQLFDAISVWDFPSQQRLGSIHSLEIPIKIFFSADGSSFLTDDYFFPMLYRWSLPDSNILAIRGAVLDFFSALNLGDYLAAAGQFQLSAEGRSDFESYGLPTDDLPALFESLCAQTQQPCMPVEEIFFEGKSYEGSYTLLIKFTAPDGSLYEDSTGESVFYIFADFNQEGDPKIILLPSFLYP